jgi:flagellar hook-basal body complex protein FliE
MVMVTNNVGGVRSDISEMLSKIRDISSKTSVFKTDKPEASSANFSNVMQQAGKVVDTVNNSMGNTDSLKEKYLQGDPNVSLAQVMLSSEKSKLAFEGLIIVRNKCLDAYKEIMSMPV